MLVHCSPTFHLRICPDKLYALSDPPKVPRPVLRYLLVSAAKKTHFVFDDQFFDQIDGVAMDSPLGPVLANIFYVPF